MSYIWQNKKWPELKWDKDQVENAYNRYLYKKGIADGVFTMLSDRTRQIMIAEILSSDTVSSSSIEGVKLQYDSVYSSILKHLDVDMAIKAKHDRNAESVSSLVIDANRNHSPLTLERLMNWHCLLFDGVAKGFAPKHIGAFRSGPIYVVHSKQRETEILYEGVPAERISSEMERLIDYINSEQEPNLLIRSAVASFWFVSIHPFYDGNGRISRAIANYILSMHSGSEFRPYNMSSAILKDRRGYYDSLNSAQNSEECDITQWIVWYVDTICTSLSDSVDQCRKKLRVSVIMESLDPNLYNSRQMHMIYHLANGSFFGKLTADKWMKMTKCQSATATRDLSDLTEKGLLVRMGEGKKGTYYLLNPTFGESKNETANSFV
ncbi:MAG: DUF4172 domain-containing protein [Sphaerochaetaceae bacterium]|nr:DUF4172 domain-containing protein [Sphaerochaetaceae bacterium]